MRGDPPDDTARRIDVALETLTTRELLQLKAAAADDPEMQAGVSRALERGGRRMAGMINLRRRTA